MRWVCRLLKNLRNGVKKNMEVSNQEYKQRVDKGRRHKYFEAGDEDMVHLKNNRFPVGTYCKLKMKKFFPCKILKKLDSGNYFEVELP